MAWTPWWQTLSRRCFQMNKICFPVNSWEGNPQPRVRIVEMCAEVSSQPLVPGIFLGSQPDVLAESFQGCLLSSEALYQERPRDPGSFQPSLSCSEQNCLPFGLLPLLPSLACTTLAFCLCRHMPQQQLLTWTPQMPRGSRIGFRRPWTLKP